MNWIQWLELINNITAPIGFLLTILTFFLARATRKRLEETEEITLFNAERTQYLGKLDGIKVVVDNSENRKDIIPEKIITNTLKLVSELENNYPYLSKKNKTIASALKDIKSLKDKTKIPLVEFIDPFNKLHGMFANQKEIK